MKSGRKQRVVISAILTTTVVCFLLGLTFNELRVVMPDLTNMDSDDAEETLMDIGIDRDRINYQTTAGDVLFTDGVREEGQNYIVIAQQPEAGERVYLPGSAGIHLLIKENYT